MSEGRPLSTDPQDALLLENDIVGVRVWGPADRPTLSLGRSDIWDRRWCGDRQPLVTLRQMREAATGGGLAALAREPNDTVYDVYMKYEFPCPKPGAQLILGLPFAAQTVAEPLPDGGLRIVATGPDARLEADLWVMLDRALVVLQCRRQGPAARDVWVRLHRHRDTVRPGDPMNESLGGGPSNRDFDPLPPPRAVVRADCWGVEQEFPAEATFPDGFRVAAAACVLGAACRLEAAEGLTGLGTALRALREGRVGHGAIKRYAPINRAEGAAVTARPEGDSAEFGIAVALTTTQDAADPWLAAEELLQEARRAGAAGLRSADRAVRERQRRPLRAAARLGAGIKAAGWYGAVGAEAAPSTKTAPELVLPNLRRRGGFYSDVALCTVGNTKFWFQDFGLWHNDFHLNELRAEPMLALGLFPELLPYCDMIATLLPMCEQNAREVYGLPGAMYPLVHFPLRGRGVAHVNLTWEQDIGLNGLASKPLWLYYRYTGDREFLRDLAWPVLRACARFCRAYLTAGPDGLLHIVPTVSPEHWGLTPEFARNRDCTSALTLTRYLLRAAAEAARVLGEDGGEAADWREAAAGLAAFPTFATPEGPVWVDVDGAPPIEYNIPVPLSPVFWGDEVGLDSPDDVLRTAHRTLGRINVWPPHRGYLTVCIRPRLGVWAEDSQVVPECLLLSYQSIRLFPCVPPQGAIAMDNMAAEGGFRVSAVRAGEGRIEDVRILSTLGGACRMANPWTGRQVRVEDGRGRARELLEATASHVAFETQAGESYRLWPG